MKDFLKMNKIVKILTVSDFFLLSSFGLLAPIFAVFITGQIGGSLKTVGIATSVYWITKCIFQLPIAKRLDNNPIERDDYSLMMVGIFMFCFVPLMYLACREPWHLYMVQFFYGLASAVSFPGWAAIFTRHIDKKREAFEWSVYSTSVSIGTAIAATAGGFVAHKFGFRVLFSAMAMLNAFVFLHLLTLKRHIIVSDNNHKRHLNR